ncbi:MAG: helix-turn-helix domain-containing protein [Cellvibrionaceae bacterium]
MIRNNTAPKSGIKKEQSHSSAKKAQQQRVLSALREAGDIGLTTIQLREDFDIMAPAPRIYELRWDYGYNIQLIWDRDQNAQGNTHSCGRYILFPGKWNRKGEAA